jgi:hypothetical protein
VCWFAAAALVSSVSFGALAGPQSAAVAKPLPMAACPGANPKVVLRCGSRTPSRGAASVVIHECRGQIASIFLPGPRDAAVKKAGVAVTHKPRLAGQPDKWEGKGFSLWVSGTHPMADGRSLAGLDTSLLGAQQSLELACQ